EELGDAVLRLLAEEHHLPELREVADRGRTYHAAWCERVFAPALRGLKGEAYSRRLAEFVAVADVSMWQVRRRDRGLSRAQTELAHYELIESLIGGMRWHVFSPTPRPGAGTCFR